LKVEKEFPGNPEKQQTQRVPADLSTPRSLKQKVAHEGAEFVWTFIYVALVLVALSTYRMMLLKEFGLKYFAWGTALFNAFVLAKVILIGEYAKLGRRLEDRAVMAVAVFKALLFTLLVLVFLSLEEFLKGFVHPHAEQAVAAPAAIRMDELACRALIAFLAFIPFFVIRELRRVLGETSFVKLMFSGRSERPQSFPFK
jgi:hypothetical protein